MRIGFECTVLTRSIAGIGYYTHHLLQALARRPGEEEYVLFYNRPLQPMELPSRLRHVLTGPASTHLWVQTRLASLCRKQAIDLLHSPGQGLPFLFDKPRILTIHDLSPLMFPRQKDLSSRFVWTTLVPIMARQADHIITVSDHTRQDVTRLLGIPEHRVTRIHEAAAPEFYPEPDAERIRKFRRGKALETGYILAVGTLEPRKNYPFLLRVFAQWLERSRPDATLVIIGKKGWLYDEIFATLAALNLHRRVRFEGYVGGPGLMRLYYSAAEFSILTPFYEGFWLPGLESLACGTPVIAPGNSSIPEVIGEAGLLVDSWDMDAWAAAMDRLWMAPDRAIWARKGIERARRFSWDRAAEETLAVYHAVIQSREGA
ncbi:MAG: glycosyltransferase family 4 protein [bacterium]